MAQMMIKVAEATLRVVMPVDESPSKGWQKYVVKEMRKALVKKAETLEFIDMNIEERLYDIDD